MSLPVAVITGTNSGVGLALSVLMAKTHRVYAGMRSLEKKDALCKAAAEQDVGDNVVPIEMDVNCDDSVAAAFNLVIEKEKKVDVLVNNAGYALFGGVENHDMAAIKAQFETNVFGVMRCQKAVLPSMRAQRSGKIINVSSIGGVWGQPFNDVYCASKFALEGMTQAQAGVFRTFGVYTTVVEPGGIKTAFIGNATKPTMLPEEYKEPLGTTMAGYGGGSPSASQTAEEVAQAIIDQVVAVAEPPVRVQTNPAIQGVFDGLLADTTGQKGLEMQKRFLPNL